MNNGTKYRYTGPIMSFGQCIKDCWTGETFATSTTKALNNLKYQVKKLCNLTSNSRIDLPGKLEEIYE